MLEIALPEFLKTITAVTDIVGDRIHPLFIPQKKPGGVVRVPCLVYAVTGDNEGKSYCGTDSTVENLLTIDCYATTMIEARRLSKALRVAILDYRGLMDTVRVRDVSLQGSLAVADMEPGLIRVVDTFSIWFEQE